MYSFSFVFFGTSLGRIGFLFSLSDSLPFFFSLTPLSAMMCVFLFVLRRESQAVCVTPGQLVNK